MVLFFTLTQLLALTVLLRAQGTQAVTIPPPTQSITTQDVTTPPTTQSITTQAVTTPPTTQSITTPAVTTPPPTQSITTQAVTTPPTTQGITTQDVTTPPTTQSITTTGSEQPLCDFNPCFNGGVCRLTGGTGYACQCPSGFTGVVCQEAVTPPTTPGTTGLVHACEFNPCYNGGFCVRVGDSYTCVCPPTHAGHVCQNVSTTPAATTVSTTPACPDDGLTLSTIGCAPMEVVFMIEYGKQETVLDIDHEGDLVKQLIQLWDVKPDGVRVAIVLYHDTVSEVIHLDQYTNKLQLRARISQIVRVVRPSGDADLAGALDFVNTNSFQDARDGVPRVVIPIVHQIPVPDLNDQLIQSAQRLKDDCTKIMPLYVYGTPRNTTLYHHVASQPFNDYYKFFGPENFNALEQFSREYTHC